MIQEDVSLAPRQVTDFIILDLDRTLFDTDRLIELLIMRLERYGVPKSETTASLSGIKSSAGQSLSMVEFLTKRHGADLVGRVIRDMEVIAQAGRLDDAELLYGGASATLLREFDARGVPYAILTYGREADQRFKLDLIRLLTGRDEQDLPAVITDEPRKGAWIHAKWLDKGSGSQFRIPSEFTHDQTIIAKRIIILDDKIANLQSPDKNVLGINIDNQAASVSEACSIASVSAYVRQGGNVAELARHYTDEQGAV